MEVFKWILLVALVGFTLWLVIDTTIWAIKKIKRNKAKKLEQKDSNSQKSE